jgi:methyl-accepting chemotaxis protein
MSEMDKVTQQNAANAEESAAASEELSSQAEVMQGFVESLMELVGGNSRGHSRQKGAPGQLPSRLGLLESTDSYKGRADRPRDLSSQDNLDFHDF